MNRFAIPALSLGAVAIAVLAVAAYALQSPGEGAATPAPAGRAMQAPSLAQASGAIPLTSVRIRAERFVQFEPNRGQADRKILYLARSKQLRVEVREDGIDLTPARTDGAIATVGLRFDKARRGGRFDAREPGDGHANYLVGSDPAHWLRDLPYFKQLRYANLYDGIDLVYYSRDGELEYDLVVKPGADPGRIRMHVDGGYAPQIDVAGNLLLDGPGGALRLHKPVLYQDIDGTRTTLAGEYVLLAQNEVGFRLPEYDHAHALIIDPTFKLLYSTYLTGFHDEQVGGVALDAQSNAYVVGKTDSNDFVVSGNALQADKSTTGLQYNVVVTKFNASGTLIYSTYLGGTGSDTGSAVAVDGTGNAYITGDTTSHDFPVTAGAQQPVFSGSRSAFLAIVSPDGSALTHATFYGGASTAQAGAIALDSGGSILLSGFAGPGLTTTAGAYKTTLATGDAAFVAKFSALAAGPPRLLAASYYGVDNPQVNDTARGNHGLAMALDASGAPWITGQAYTTNLPVTTGAVQAAPTSMSASCAAGAVPLNSFAFVARLSADLRSLVYASYLTGATEPAGGATCSEFGRAIGVDAAGNVYITGATASATFPTTTGAAQPTFPSSAGVASYTGFVTKLNADGSILLWSTYLGGTGGNTFPAALVLDAATNAVWTVSVTGGGSNYPVTGDAVQPTHGGGGADAGIVQLDAATGVLRHSTFLGGASADVGLAIAVDGGGNVFVAGNTFSTNFPLTANAYEREFRPDFYGGADWFFSVLGNGLIGTVRPASGGNSGDVTLRLSGAGFQPDATCALAGAGVTLVATLSGSGADGGSMNCTFALAGAAPGTYDVTVSNPDGSRITRAAAFTVTTGSGGSDLSVDVIGRSVVRVGVPSVFDINVTNIGDADALGVVLYVRYSAGFRPVDPTRADPFDLQLIPPSVFLAGADDSARPPIVSKSAEVADASVVALFLPSVAVGETISLPFKLMAVAESEDEFVEAFAYDALADSAADSAAPLSGASSQTRAMLQRAMAQAMTGDRKRPEALSKECVKALWDLAWEKATGKIPGVDCFRDVRMAAVEGIIYTNSHPGNRAAFFGDVAGAAFKGATSCAELTGIELAAPIEAARIFQDLVENAEKFSDKCKDKDKKKKGKPKATKKTKIKKSGDPNDKSGPDGDGSTGHYVRALDPFAYKIAFENMATAGLPAATVVVTDQLDPIKYDLMTLSLGSISWGSYRIDVPPGLNTFATTYAIGPGLSLRVQGSLNISTGLLKWTFTTIDPATKLPPSDPSLGFLPPNTDGVKGQGYVNFMVSPRSGLADGTEWKNGASIVFDANAPIPTPVWTHTLDTTAPVSKVQSVVGQVGTTEFDVSWASTVDGGSALRTYTVYVSDNAGSYSVWQDAVSVTSATYEGASGHTYAFNVVATDGAGNTEGAKTEAEANITVTGNFGDPSNGSGGGCTIGGDAGRDVTLPVLVFGAAALLALSRRRRRRASEVGVQP